VGPDGEELMSDILKPFKFIGDNSDLVWTKTLEHLKLSGVAMLIALLIALPVGIWLGHLRRGSFIAINVGNFGRALPSLAVISVGLGIFGIGFWNVVFALVILAVPPILTNAYVAVAAVDRDVQEAARGMGMTGLQMLFKVELPLALPLMFAGIRTAAVFVIATAPLAAIAGGGGLGDIIVNQAGYKLEGVIAAALCVAALALVAELGFASIQRAVTPPGLRKQAPALGPANTTV
jgi:osmoprotectant transport system permease protein